MTSRRGFLGSIAALCAGAGVAPTLAAQVEAAELDGGLDAVGVLVQCIHIHGADATAAAIVGQPGPVDAYQVRRVLRQQARRAKRARDAWERREAHAGDEVLFRGPVCIDDWTALLGHWHPSPSRRYDVARTLCEWAIYGRLAPRPEGYRRVERDGRLLGWAPDCDDYPIDDIVLPVLPPLLIAAGSRVLISTRNGGQATTMACEVLHTGEGFHRVHLWRRAQEWVQDTPIAVLAIAGQDLGRRYETTEDGPRVGLMGLPL
jgi:hypothetical protein